MIIYFNIYWHAALFDSVEIIFCKDSGVLYEVETSIHNIRSGNPSMHPWIRKTDCLDLWWPFIYHPKLGHEDQYFWGWSHLRFLASTSSECFWWAVFLTFSRWYIMPLEIKMHPILLEPASLISTASNRSFWEHLTPYH